MLSIIESFMATSNQYLDQYIIGSEKEVTKAAGSKGTVADDNFKELTQILSPNLQLSDSKMMFKMFSLVVCEGLVSRKLVR